SGQKIGDKSKIDLDHSYFIFEDTPGLNRFNPNVRLEYSIDQALSDPSRYEIFELSFAEIGDAVPHRIFDKENRSYRLVREPPGPGGITSRGRTETSPGPAPQPEELSPTWYRFPPTTSASPTPTPVPSQINRSGPLNLVAKRDCKEEQMRKIYLIV